MKFTALIIAIILFFSLLLRFHNYDVYPQRGATSDEYTYSFLGVSLLTKHKPVSWSYFSAYKNRNDIVINKIHFPIVEPYFDHPPLFGLVVGAWAIVFGENTFQKIELHVIRLVPIILSLLSSTLLFLIAKRLYDKKTAFFSLLIFSTVTVFVINMRVVVSENILAALFLAAVFLFVKWKEKMTGKKALILGIICGLAFLSKILGIAGILFMLYFLFDTRQKPKHTAFLFIGFLICAIALFVYGFSFGKDLFLQIQFAQSSRYIGPKEFWYIVTTPIIINVVYQDPWYFFGFFSLFFSFFDYAKNKFITIPALIYFFLAIITLTQEGQSGWYLIPFFPFLAITTAHLLVLAFKKTNLLPLVFFLFLGLSQYHILFENNFGESIIFYRLFVLVLVAPLLLTILWKKELLYRTICNTWFYIFILGTAYITYHYIHPV